MVENIIWLSNSAIKGSELNVNIKDIDQLLEKTRAHQLDNLIYIAFKKNDFKGLSDDIIYNIRKRYKHAVAIDAGQDYHLSIVKEALENNGIDYTILKGWAIKSLYPESHMRTAADIDIYIGSENAERVHDIMLDLGYKCSAYGENGSTDNYSMDKYSNFEFHRRLISNNYPWKDECNKITDRLIHKHGHEYVMSNEDFYVFMICHIAKHIKFGGIGIRAILDVWVYLDKYKNLDWDYIKDIIEKCHLTEFHGNILKLVRYWFEDEDPDDKIIQLSEYIAESGWNGTIDQWISGDMAEMAGQSNSKNIARIKLYLSAFFWSRRKMAVKYPILNKIPILLPLLWAHRALNAFINKKDVTKEILEKYDNADMDAGKKIQEFRRSIGV